jgi:hypothetical protein
VGDSKRVEKKAAPPAKAITEVGRREGKAPASVGDRCEKDSPPTNMPETTRSLPTLLPETTRSSLGLGGALQQSQIATGLNQGGGEAGFTRRKSKGPSEMQGSSFAIHVSTLWGLSVRELRVG